MASDVRTFPPMKSQYTDAQNLDRLIAQLEAVRQSAYWLEGEFEAELSKVTGSSRESARNLLHYLALRRHDLRSLQSDLASLGLSSLGRSESHVLGTVYSVLSALHGLAGRAFDSDGDGMRPVRFLDGPVLLGQNTAELFGRARTADGREDTRPRIMVTMPVEAATEYHLVHDLVANGMNCMRINCAHETPEIWSSMIENLEKAKHETGNDCLVYMDIAGPKLRTGPIVTGPQVIRWEPKRDVMGEVVSSNLVWLTPAERPEPPPRVGAVVVPIEGRILARLRSRDKIVFRDARGRSRKLHVRSASGASWVTESRQITYLSADCELSIQPGKKSLGTRDLPGAFRPTAIPPVEQVIFLQEGDSLTVTRDVTPGRPVERDLEGRLLEEPRIACTLPEVFGRVREGDRVLFDEGKIGGVVSSASSQEFRVEIDWPIGAEKKLRADKGINFPDTDLGLPAVTDKDREDLDFIVRHADMVGASFVNRPEDVECLHREIFRRTGRKIGLVLKIETKHAFRQLPKILLTAMQHRPVGVMIARGDLAVECGYERLAEIQEEILWICEAAHVPVIWATQVLNRLAKKGVPTRAEVTDAAMAERAECVMLNKGPHIVRAVQVLDDILRRMSGHHDKKSATLRALGVSFPDT